MLEMDLAERRIKRENLENRCQEYYHCAIAELGSTDAGRREPTNPVPRNWKKPLPPSARRS
jgi:chromosome segregation protein